MNDKRRYEYIELVEEFFKEYNNKLFGAILINFFGQTNIPFPECSDDLESLYNSNMIKTDFMIKRGLMIPYVQFSCKIKSLNNSDTRYIRTITLLRNDILSANSDYIEYAISSFENYKNIVFGKNNNKPIYTEINIFSNKNQTEWEKIH